MYGEFSRIAAANPAAWKRAVAAPEVIRDDSAANPMIAFPYTKAHVSNWSVDQASALLLCSAEAARSAGVPADRWVFPLASAVSDHMVPLSERAELHRSPGAELAARRALDHAGVVPDRITCADIYSCFPVAVLVHAAAVGLPGSIPFTVTGGMPFAGGPFNNYALHATVQLARRLRRRPHGTGVVSSVSGVLTKHGFGVWGIDPPVSPFRFDDVTAATAATTGTTPVVVDGYQGGGRIAGSTVIYENGRPRRAVAVIDTDDGRRALAWSEDPMVMADMARDEFGGHPVMVRSDTFTPRASSAAAGGRG
jgi:acetyl-CoA C-acetyltransferase